MVKPLISLTSLATTLLTGLFFSAMFLLISLSLNLLRSVIGVINFANGGFFALGAYTAVTVVGFMQAIALPIEMWYLGLVGAGIILGLLGVCVELGLLRRTYVEGEEIYQLLLTYGLGLVIYDVIKGVWGVFPLTIPQLYLHMGFIPIGDFGFPAYNLLVILSGYLISLLLWFWIYRTASGRLIRAAALDKEMSRALGIDVKKLYTLAFAVAIILAGLSGALVIPIRSAVPGMGTDETIVALAIIAIGGLGSLKGAFVASHLIGIARAFGIGYFPEIELAIVFIVTAIVLVVRPTGFFGREEKRL